MIQGKVVAADKYEDLITVWNSVFQDFDITYQFKDENIYIVLYEGVREDKPIGAAELKMIDGECFIDRLAVLSEKRNNRNGEFLLRFALDKGFSKGYEKIYTSIQKEQKGIFSQVGFNPTKIDKINSNTIKCEISPDKFYKHCRN
ncbi:GNAT family N-acetyltransferase [Anaerocolumna sp. AGMB13020]|uniref:GNAT family N-acetyltransferase n=1 Tax=Anaerocolumna sp. AGMB13020 TaxID=3081750 RepID=UPI002954F9DF|nr:GNAT family N-acetyltransferase [Anaerocolumna sp. AGMB13020]WOO34579.1 GNAT family N-acetyltransferase [Anaerocolumna sp. AGMB13020]